MSEGSLIVPVLTPLRNVHFASVGQAATVKDVIDVLLLSDEVKDEICGDICDNRSWELQTVTNERPGRTWEEGELDSFDYGEQSTSRRNICTSLKSIPQAF